MGVDFQGRKGEVEPMAPLSILLIPKEFREHGPGQGGERAKSGEPTWIPLGRGKESSSVFETRSALIGSTDPTNAFARFPSRGPFGLSPHISWKGVCGGEWGDGGGMGKTDWHSL